MRDAGRPAEPSGGEIRVAIVDDHQLMREGLRMVLSAAEGLRVVGEAGSHADALELVDSTAPDVLLLDLTLQDGDALPLLRVLRARHPSVSVVVLTMDRGSETVRQALVAGASGYVVKGARSQDLVDAIHAVMRGERYLHSSVTGAVVEDSIRWIQAGSSISVREREILSLLAGGSSPTEIAHTLGISIYTVRRHVANLSAKLDLRGRTALTRYALKHGLVRETPSSEGSA